MGWRQERRMKQLEEEDKQIEFLRKSMREITIHQKLALVVDEYKINLCLLIIYIDYFTQYKIDKAKGKSISEFDLRIGRSETTIKSDLRTYIYSYNKEIQPMSFDEFKMWVMANYNLSNYM